MAEYIERENAYKLIHEQKEKETGMYSKGRNRGLNVAKSIIHDKGQCPTVDVVKVVRCKDCIYFQPDFVLTNDGKRRPYTQEEKESGFGYVSMDKGINCGSRCERHGYWEENKIPVWFSENDFCSYGELKE